MKAIAAAILFLCASMAYAWSPLDSYIAKECRSYDVPFGVAERLITSESSWNPDAVNPADPSVGIAQLQVRLLPWFARMFNDNRPINPYDAFTSVHVMIRYLSWLHHEIYYRDWWYSVMAYKVGLGDPTRGYITEPRVYDQVPLRIRQICWWVAHGD